VGSHCAELTRVDALRERFAAMGQGHVFRFWDSLGDEARQRLIRQAEGLDLPALLRAFAASKEVLSQAPQLEPAAVEALPERGGDRERWRAAQARGEALLAAGRVSIMVVAGGQATRLGYPGPKGAYPLGPITKRSLFELQAQKIRRLRARFGQPLPWYIMTSPATDSDTRALFARASQFGLPPEDVFFLCQGMVPSFDFDGKLMLAAPDRIFENPDGHGGSIPALDASGALDDMASRGIDTIFYYQVDNPLTQIGSPSFLGFHAECDAQMSCKVLRKRDAAENVGVVARVNGSLGVIEYTEIDPAQRSARDVAGELVYWAGNMAVHVLNVEFVRELAKQAERLLPFHASPKKIPTLDAQGRSLVPAAPNGLKLERFVFDALGAARRVCVVEAQREQEYAPVKNAENADSPATARRALSAQYRSWLEAAGVVPLASGLTLEIDESALDGPEAVRNLGIRRIEEAGEVIRTASGDEA
jgi:UDP-N-acetylglucosamine pyrophosphorylase